MLSLSRRAGFPRRMSKQNGRKVTCFCLNAPSARGDLDDIPYSLSPQSCLFFIGLRIVGCSLFFFLFMRWQRLGLCLGSIPLLLFCPLLPVRPLKDNH